MNFKTTLTLVFTLTALVLALYVVQSKPSDAQSSTSLAPPTRGTPTARDLIEDKPGDIVKVVCTRQDKPEWVFEKREPEGGGAAQWWMTAPSEMKVVSWEVDKFGRQLGNLQYEISYRPGEAGAVSAKDAGLDPPQATVTLTDVDGKTVTVEVGKAASEHKTYVRLAGDNRVCVGRSNLRTLFKSKAIEYRDKALWSFDAQDATRLEITDRSDPEKPVDYVFVNDGAIWMMESPVTARVTDKVAGAIRAVARFRASQWETDDPKQLGVYGLDPASLIVKVTAETTVDLPAEDTVPEEADATESEESTEQSEPQTRTEIKTSVYELHVSNLSPIGEETKTYIRSGDGTAVGTVMKSTADKLRPVMKEWRDMAVTPVDVMTATRIELSTASAALTLIKQDGVWTFEADDGRAEESAVTGLLGAVRDLNAVSFTETSNEDTWEIWFDNPQADIHLTIPGVEGVERIVIGAHTDAKSKRLLYARRNSATSIAKVRSSDVQLLLRNPLAYRDRTIVDIPRDQLTSITIEREEPCTGERMSLTFGRDGETWALTAPVAAKLRADRTKQLADAVSDLRAEAIVADEGEASAYGLHDPAVTVTLSREEDAESWALLVTEHDGRFYARRSDRPAIYEVAQSLFDRLQAEYRPSTFFAFDDAQVDALSIRIADESLSLKRRGESWIYPVEPDLPLDSKKVDDLLLRVRDLQTERYIAYGVTDNSAFGLHEPRCEVTVTLHDGTRQVLRISAQNCERSDRPGFLATVVGTGTIVVVAPDTMNRLRVSLDELE